MSEPHAPAADHHATHNAQSPLLRSIETADKRRDALELVDLLEQLTYSERVRAVLALPHGQIRLLAGVAAAMIARKHPAARKRGLAQW